MDDVAAREIPVYFEVEEEIISAAAKVTKTTFLVALPALHLVSCLVFVLVEVCIAHSIVVSDVFSVMLSVDRYHHRKS